MDNKNNKINEWYAEQLRKIAEEERVYSRLETNIDEYESENLNTEKISKIETKVSKYDEIQTNFEKAKSIINNSKKIKTVVDNSKELEKLLKDKQSKLTNINKKTKRFTKVINGAKTIENGLNRFIRVGKTINAGLDEGELKSFQNSLNRIMTKPIKKVENKVISKTTNKLVKVTKKVGKKVRSKYSTTIVKVIKLVAKLVENSTKTIIAMLPEIAPIIIIIVITVSFCSFFGLGMSEDTKKKYETYMIDTQNQYDSITIPFYNNGKIVEGAIEGKGMINWKAPLSILQIINGNLTFDIAEIELLDKFKKAGLFEIITDVEYSYEKENEIIDINGNKSTIKQTVKDVKKIVKNSSLDEFIDWCNNNYNEINNYKQIKNISYDYNQTRFTDEEIEQIKLLYKSNDFFNLFSEEFKEKYEYLAVSVGDEQIQAIYNEFLINSGKRYLMDHSNLSYDSCMEYYDCSSWVIHCLAHTGIATIPNTTASGIYTNYCVPINVEERKARRFNIFKRYI